MPEGTGLLLTTSGTTGEPKVVCHAWSALRSNAEAASARLDYGPGDTWLATLAWAHVGGLGVALRAAAVGGRIGFGPGRFEAAGAGAALADLSATHVSLVPVMLYRLLEAGIDPPASLRCAVVGGDAAAPALVLRALDAGWPVALTYGLTEAGSQVTTAPPHLVRERPDRVGFPLEGMEVRVAADGRIEVRGESLCLGSLHGPSMAVDTRSPRAGPRRWLRTDDFGAWDPADGLRVTGRAKTRIVTGGTNVDPSEVEAVLEEHEAIREACVIGTPDPLWGEIVTAVVVPARPRPGLVGELAEWAARRLEGPRRPRAWRIVGELPRTASGKVDRRRVREEAALQPGDA